MVVSSKTQLMMVMIDGMVTQAIKKIDSEISIIDAAIIKTITETKSVDSAARLFYRRKNYESDKANISEIYEDLLIAVANHGFLDREEFSRLGDILRFIQEDGAEKEFCPKLPEFEKFLQEQLDADEYI